MSIVEQFAAAVMELTGGRPDDDFLLPATLSRACVAVLPVAGASLSLLDDMVRMPLGASDDPASLAEMLQFTQGDGPCLAVYREQRPTCASSSEIRDRWPIFFTALAADTPYRSVASVPLRNARKVFGALDLYRYDEAGMDAASMADAVRVAGQIAVIMSALPDPGIAEAEDVDITGSLEPRNPASRRRGRAWIAIGMIRASSNLNAQDALDLIRAYSWSHNLTLDTVAGRLVGRDLTTTELLQSELPRSP